MVKKKASRKKSTRVKKAKKFNLRSKLTSAIRRIWFYGPQRKECLRLAKLNGNICAICKNHHIDLQVDHIDPVVPLTGWDGNWTAMIERMFVDPVTGLRAVGKECHEAHTAVQKSQRKENKKC